MYQHFMVFYEEHNKLQVFSHYERFLKVQEYYFCRSYVRYRNHILGHIWPGNPESQLSETARRRSTTAGPLILHFQIIHRAKS